MSIYLFDWVDTAATTVLHATWQGVVLALAVFAITRLSRGGIPANWRFGLWLVVFARLSMPWIPATSWSLYSILPSFEKHDSSIGALSTNRLAGGSTSFLDHSTQFSDRPVNVSAHSQRQPMREASGNANGIVARTNPGDTSSISGYSHLSMSRWFAFVWLTGIAVLAGRMIWQYRCLIRHRAEWPQSTDPKLDSLLQRCRSAASVRRPVMLKLAAENVGPATCGVLTPSIVLPASMRGLLTTEELRLVLLHELIHVRRSDVFIDGIAAVITCIHWFNPMVWLSLAELRRERELACDAALLDLEGTDARRDYGSTLIRVVESLRPEVAIVGSVAIFEGRLFGDSLEARVASVAEYQPPNRFARLLSVSLLVSILAVGLTDAVGEAPNRSSVVGAKADDAKTRAIKISGVCVDEADRPLADVKVALYRTDHIKGEDQTPIQETRSDLQGRYEFAGVPVPQPQEEVHMNYVTVLTMSGRASELVYVHSLEADKKQKASLIPAAEVTGRVTDPDGKPLAGAVVWTHGIGSGPLQGVLSAKTGADGRYKLTDLKPFDAETEKPIEFGKETTLVMSSFFMRARHPDFEQKSLEVTRAPGTADFVLEYGGVIEGEVIDSASGKPAANAPVTVRLTPEDHGDNLRQTHTDNVGRYRVSGLKAGQYAIWSRTDDLTCVALQEIPVVAREVSQAPNLQLISGAWIEGKIVSEGARPLALDPETHHRLRIGLHGPSYPQLVPGTEWFPVNDEGQFRIRVAPGQNFLKILSNGNQLWSRTQRHEEFDQGIEIAAGETRRVLFRVLSEKQIQKAAANERILPIPVPTERQAADAVRDLGGAYELDVNGHVIEVNMVWYIDQGQRHENKQMTDEALAHLPAFPHLKRLYLKETQASDAGLESVAELPELETLMIWDASHITDEGIAHLRTLKNLKEIHLSGSKVTDKAILLLSDIPALEEISMQENDFTDKAFEYAKRLPRLKSLIINNGPHFTDQGMKHVREMPTLEELWLAGTEVTDNGLRELHGLKILKLLQLSESPKITEAAILQLQASVPDLKVDLAGTRIFQSRNSILEATSPKQKEINRKEAPQGLKTIERFVELMTLGKDGEAAELYQQQTIWTKDVRDRLTPDS